MPADQPNQPPIGHPTDHGWAWVTCLACGIANFYVTGGVRSVGMLAVELIRYYKPNPVLVQLVTAFLGANFAIFSFIGNILGVRFTMHRIAITGAILSIVGKLIAAFAPNMMVVILGLGIFSGAGYGFMFGPTLVLVGQYFVKRRSFANGLSIAGGSVGQLILPWFITGVMNLFAFRGGMLLYAGLATQALPAMFLLREPSFYSTEPKPQKAVKSKPSKKTEPLVNELGEKIIIPRTMSQSVDPLERVNQQHRPSISLLALQNTIDVDDTEVAENYHVQPEQVTHQMHRRSLLRMICDPELLCNPVFIIYVLAVSIGHGGYMVTCFYIPLYTNERWDSEAINAALMSTMGVADLAGRVLGGYIADRDVLPKTYLVSLSFAICGTTVMFIPFFNNVYVMFGCITMFGLVGGSYLSMLVVLVIELFGEEKLPVGLGLTTLSMGLSLLPIPPLLAEVARRTGTYGSSIRTSAVLMIIGSIMFAMVLSIKKHRNCKPVRDMKDSQVQTDLLPRLTSAPAAPVRALMPRDHTPRPSVDNGPQVGKDYRWSQHYDDAAPESNL